MQRFCAIKRSVRFFSPSPKSLARVLASDPIESICGQIFRSRGHEFVEMPGIKKEELIKVIGDFDALVVRSGTKVTKEVLEAGHMLKIVGRAGTGVDNIDVKFATNKGILVANTPGANTISTGELAFSHILGLARNIPQATMSLKKGFWERNKYMGTELSGKTIGIIGIGKIGREVGRWCKGLGMTVVGYDPILSEQSARGIGIDPVSLDELFSKADFISIHAPLTKETYHLMNASNLSKCKRGVRIVNCARGGIVDESALLESISSGHVAAAALDVLEEEPPTDKSLPLRAHENVVVTPHLGASTVDAQERVAKAIAENLCDILEGDSFTGVVNSPNLGAVAKDPQSVPYVLLGERIGSMHAQLIKQNKIGSLQINLQGRDICSGQLPEVIKTAVLKGALSELVETTVTYVNANSLAEEIGLPVLVNLSERTNEQSGYTNSMSVELQLEGWLNMNRSIEGTVFGRSDLRITKVDGYSVELPPSENILLFNNFDRPGVLLKVSRRLAEAKINIAKFVLGRIEAGKMAMGALILDSPVPADVLSSLSKTTEIHNVMQIHLPNVVDSVFRVNREFGAALNVQASSKPSLKPVSPEFSSGPCKKRPGYSLANLRSDSLGRSHRSKLGKQRLKKAIVDTKSLLQVPEDYLCGIVPASDTGAFEMAMWSMLGERPVDTCHWESFGKGWKEDVVKHLKISNVREFSAPYGQIPDLRQTNPNHDILFTFNGTTSGVRVPNLDWVSSEREGLTFNDATSAAFAMEIDWPKVDVTTFSWQKALGGEGAHGVIILSPRAVHRLENFKPPRPLPKVFRMTKQGKDGKTVVDKGIFEGDTINTPSMLCVEDYLDALEWAESVGGLRGMIDRSQRNLRVLTEFVNCHDWIHFLAKDETIRSSTSVCLTLDLPSDKVKKFVGLLEQEHVALDIGSYRDAPDGLRIWCGATVEESDLIALMPWLEWAYNEVKK